MSHPTITFLTDFGGADPYVGQMKGALLARLPGATVVDLTHQVPPQDIRRGAIYLADSVRHFPPGTVHVAVVDPGVGSERRPLAASAGRQLFVGPDNGLLWPALQAVGGARRVHVIESPACMAAAVSRTFHGRDIFAPAAAFLARGNPIESTGPPAGEIIELEIPEPQVTGSFIRGEVLYTDRFGSLVTNITAKHGVGEAPGRVLVGAGADAVRVPLVTSYSEVAPGEPCALIGGSGRLELAVRDGDAAQRLDAGPGTPLTVERS